MRLIRTFLLAFLAIAGLFGQTFEVASIRFNGGPRTVEYRFTASGPRLTLEGYPPIALVAEAYDLKGYQIAFGYTRAGTGRLQHLLRHPREGGGRCQSLTRRVPQDAAGADGGDSCSVSPRDAGDTGLCAGGKGWPKFKQSAPDAVPAGRVGRTERDQDLTLTKATMATLVESLQGAFLTDRPVVDQAGMSGTYDIKVTATPRAGFGNGARQEDINVLDAVQSTLGLKLEPQKAMVEVLIVDRIEKPSEN